MLRLITDPLPVTAPNRYLHINRDIGSNLAKTLPLKEQTCFQGPKSVLWWEIFLSLRKGHFDPSSYRKEAGSCEVRAIGGQPGQSGLAQRQQSHPIHNQTCNFNIQNKICHIAFVSLPVFHKVILLFLGYSVFLLKSWPSLRCPWTTNGTEPSPLWTMRPVTMVSAWGPDLVLDRSRLCRCRDWRLGFFRNIPTAFI